MEIISRKTKDPIIFERSVRPEGVITITIQGKDGIVRKRKQFPMHSMTQNYWRCMAYQMGSNPGTNDAFVRTSGTAAGVSNGVNTGSRYYGISEVGEIWGLRVGTGDTPVALNDLTLDTIIEHGTGAGQLNHLETFGSPTATDVTFTRAFENLSGSDITVRELAVFIVRDGDGTSKSFPYLMARDILPTPFTIAHNEVMTASAVLFASEGTKNMHRAWTDITTDSGNWGSTIWDRDGGTRTLGSWIRSTEGLAGDNLKGIFLGTSANNQPDFEDLDLEARLPQGDASGQLLYGDTVPEDWSIDSQQIEWQMRRTIFNDSGEDYTIREMGLFCDDGSFSYLLDRFLLPVPIELSNGENREARWRFSYSI